MITAAGIAKIDRCAFKVVASPHPKNSRAIVSKGGALDVDRCWFQGFDKAIELSAVGGIPARIQQTMIVPAPGLARSQAQPPELYGWGVKVQLVSGGGAQTKNLPPHLILEHCTVEGAGLLDLAFSPVSVPFRVEVNHCAVQAEAILACKPGKLDAPPTARFHWLGESNQYDILGRSWIVLSASQGTPAFSTAVTDLDSWLRFTPDDSSPIRTKLKFLTDPAARSELPRPRDFAIEASGLPRRSPVLTLSWSARGAARNPADETKLGHDARSEAKGPIDGFATRGRINTSALVRDFDGSGTSDRPPGKPGGFGSRCAGRGVRRHRHQPSLHLEGMSARRGGCEGQRRPICSGSCR